MIYLTRLNGSKYCLMADLIEEVEAKPNTVIKLKDGNVHVVAESVEEVRQEVIDFYRKHSARGNFLFSSVSDLKSL